jgi:hypothetical protein
MSTRSTLALVNDADGVVLHLYHEAHDGEVHVEIRAVPSNALINVAIPRLMVPGVTAILKRAERP